MQEQEIEDILHSIDRFLAYEQHIAKNERIAVLTGVLRELDRNLSKAVALLGAEDEESYR